MIEQMEKQMSEESAADERQLRERILATSALHKKLLNEYQERYGAPPTPIRLDVAASSYEDREPNAIYLDNGKDYDPSVIDHGVANSVESFLDAEDQAAAQDFATRPDPYETT